MAGKKAGSQFSYASSTYILLKFIIERVTGQSYEENIEEHIFKPAGMLHSGVVDNERIVKNRALGYVWTDAGFQNATPIATSKLFMGAASIYSTTEDLLKWDQALYGDKLLSSQSKHLLFTPVIAPYGYGWFISENPQTGKVVSHGGDIFGYTSLMERRMKDKVVILILSNLQGVDREAIVKVLNQTLSQ
ncbi:MAG: beta-lactamase family protein [Gloeocapsa sp. UFS-A4-WI-NPMV-4B04]|nr:beta-lactamase family protein [Gloeocapsa sp. UFS-A4-WI-NPMV-4B04]